VSFKLLAVFFYFNVIPLITGVHNSINVKAIILAYAFVSVIKEKSNVDCYLQIMTYSGRFYIGMSKVSAFGVLFQWCSFNKH
jgi:hypothetical protein